MLQPIVSQLSTLFKEAILKTTGLQSPPQVAPAQNKSFGDYQCNAAMGLVKKVAEQRGTKVSPRDIAQEIINALPSNSLIDSVSIAGPGFINVRISPKWIEETITKVSIDERLAIPQVASSKRIVVDYSGPNIAKQMHVGHLRSTIIGDCLARVFEFSGHEVIRQNHFGDWGTQFGMLITHLQDSLKASGSVEIKDLEDFYKTAKERFDTDDDFQQRARATVVRLQQGEKTELDAWNHIVSESRKHFNDVYGKLHVDLTIEHERGESFYNPFLADTVSELVDKGIAVPSDGAIVIFNDKFESPLIIKKSDGGYLYGTTDLAAIRYRINTLKAQEIIYVHDSRQFQHFTQVFDAAYKALWSSDIELKFAPFGTMLGDDGKPFKTRAGGTVKLIELLDEAVDRAYNLVSEKNPNMAEEERKSIAAAVGIGAVKYSDLSKDRTGDYVFAWEKMISLDGNTGPYLQYAYTRIKSIFRKSGGDIAELQNHSISLSSPYELELAKVLLRFSEILEVVARELKPHHLCNYLYELSGTFNVFYENCPVLQSEGITKSSRLILCHTAAQTLKLGLQILGIPLVEKM